jgi:hypothetical protein
VYKEKIEDQYAVERSKDRRAATELKGDKRLAGQKDHHDIGDRQT